MEDKVLERKKVAKAVYEDLMDYFENMTDADKEDVLYKLLNQTFKDLYMNPEQIGDCMVHNVKTYEERYTLEDFSLALFGNFLSSVIGVIYCCEKELNID